MADEPGGGLTGLGKFISVLLILGLVGMGAWLFLRDRPTPAPVPDDDAALAGGPAAGHGPRPGRGTSPAGRQAPAPVPAELEAMLVPAHAEVPALAPPVPYEPQDNTLDIELSEYAGYAGLIAANGGADPSEDSIFFKRHGFKVRLTFSEESNWSALNSGKMAATATTVDVLAVYGRQFQVVVPVQIGYSRGADGIAVRSEIKRFNDLRGRILAAEQFTETDFFARYLAQEAGMGVHVLDSLAAAPAPDQLNLVYCETAFEAGDLFAAALEAGVEQLAGCVTWDPKFTEVAEGSAGQARVLTTNKNLLIVADILVVNRGFAEAHPQMVAGLVEGLLEGNRMVRDNPSPHLDVIARAFNADKDPGDVESHWTRDSARDELAKVHLSNLPENLAFFSGSIDAAGSFGGIYQSAVYAYGPELIRDPLNAERFLDLSHLQALEEQGTFREQKIAIAPIRTSAPGTVEVNPLLSKDIRFLFDPNVSTLDLKSQENLENLKQIAGLLQVSPGSTVLLRGHVDGANVPEFRAQGPDFLRTMTLKAVQLSQDRADEIRRLLIERHEVAAERLETVGLGWKEPVSADSEANRRVEVQWFTVE